VDENVILLRLRVRLFKVHSLSVDARFCVELESNLFKCALQFLPCSVLVQFVFAILIIVHGYITDNDTRKNTYTN